MITARDVARMCYEALPDYHSQILVVEDRRRYGYVIVCGMRPFSINEQKLLLESLNKALPAHWTPEVVSMPGFEDAVYKVLTF